VTDDLGTVRWFGESWGAPICDPRTHVPTPVGAVCSGHDHLHEDRPATIEPGARGVTIPYLGGSAGERVVYHLTCWLHEVGVNVLDNTERTT
jgi:hypothetical protein